MHHRKRVHLQAVLYSAAFVVCLAGIDGLLAQEPAHRPPSAPPGPHETAAQHFKNVQVLKDIPADQLIPTMQFITASLGVECEFCHVEHQMDKDDKDNKKFAREMIKMELTLNKEHFDGEIAVTCYTCHRGSSHPVGTPILSADAGHAPVHVHDEAAEADKQPKPEVILDRYLAAVGGAEALAKINTRVQKGNITAFGHAMPIVIYSEAPEKRVSVTQQDKGPSVTAFNGEAGWLSMPGNVHRMSPAETEAARIDAQLRFPSRIRELYQEFRVRTGEEINGHPTILVSARGEGRPPLRLYFDPESGLLVRLIRYAETPLGRLPTQIDYADYKDVNGVKMPFRWTLARPNGAFTIQIDSTEVNVPVDEKIFVLPAEPAHP